MRNMFLLIAALFGLSPVVAVVQTPQPDTSIHIAAPPRDPGLPAGETVAASQLSSSPRHGEYVQIPLMGEETRLRAWVVYPESNARAGTVLVVHEVFGLSDWIRALADQLAKEGFVAVVPDLISGMGPNGGGTESVSSRDDVVKLVFSLPPAETRKRLDAARDWALRQASTNGRYATIGFCWGGARSFECAAVTPPPRGSVVYYGVAPDSATLPAIKAPVLAFYGGDDARVTSTIPAAQHVLDKLHRSFETHVYEGAGHGFLRQQDGRNGANLRAAQQAWPRTLEFLREKLK